jgi:hypothetical protein
MLSKKHLGNFTENIQRCLDNIGVKLKKKEITPTQHIEYTDRIEQYIKVNLANVPIKK